MAETCLNYTTCPEKRMWFSSDERRWVNKITKLARDHPDEVTILRQPSENDGCIYASLPVEYLKIAPKKRVNLTDEQLAALRERGKMMAKSAD